MVSRVLNARRRLLLLLRAVGGWVPMWGPSLSRADVTKPRCPVPAYAASQPVCIQVAGLHRAGNL